MSLAVREQELDDAFFRSRTYLKRMETYARNFTRDYKIKVRYGTTCCFTTSRVIFMNTSVPSGLSFMDRVRMNKTTLVHECGHGLYTEFDPELEQKCYEKKMNPQIVHQLWNILEDRWIERRLSEDYPGVKDDIWWSNQTMSSVHDPNKGDVFSQYMTTLMLFAICYMDKTDEIEDETVVELIERSKDIVFYSDSSTTSLENAESAMLLYEIIRPHVSGKSNAPSQRNEMLGNYEVGNLPENAVVIPAPWNIQMPKQMPTNAQSQSEGTSGENDKSGNSMASTEPEEPGNAPESGALTQESNGESETDDPKQESNQASESSSEKQDEVFEDVEEDEKEVVGFGTKEELEQAFETEQKTQVKVLMNIETRTKDISVSDPLTDIEIEVIQSSRHENEYDDEEQYRQWVQNYRPVIRSMDKEFKKLFDEENLPVPNQTSGTKIKNVWRKDGKVFVKKKLDLDNPMPSISCFVDMSGSMYARLREVKTALMILQEFCHMNDIPFSIVTHQAISCEDKVVIRGAKWFEEEKGYLTDIVPDENTREGVSLEWMGKYIQRQGYEKNWLFVLSDGQPYHNGRTSSYGNEIAEEDVRNREKALNRMGIYPIGVGLNVDISNLYKHSILIEDMAQLPRKLFTIIKRKVMVYQ